MDVRALVVDLAEKIALLSTAALIAVLVPPFRQRLLGLGRPRDRLAAVAGGLVLSMWGAYMGQWWLDQNVNLRTIGVFVAASLGGLPAGLLTGLLAGVFFVARVDPAAGVFGVLASVLDGAIAGIVVDRYPRAFRPSRAFWTSLAVQACRGSILAVAFAIQGTLTRELVAWPPQVIQALGNAAGTMLFVVVARVVIAREEAAVALVEAKADAEKHALDALRRRLEPHFLFNALNALRATIRKDPERARALVADLADLYRYLLRHPEDATVANEVNHANAYLAIERARLGDDRLAVDKEIENGTENAIVPALLLQPLVENAVKHGVGTRSGRGTVSLRARRIGEKLVLEVRDRASGPRGQPRESGEGMALATLRERLAKRFGDEAKLELVPDEEGMCARVELPFTDG